MKYYFNFPGGKTGIGKIVIYLVDENDNYPVITTTEYIMCEDKEPIFITAFDADLPPYSVPFHFEIEMPTDSTWRITQHDGMLWFVYSMFSI